MRRRALWWLFAAGGALFLVLGAIDNRMWDAGGPGIVGFELAGNEENAEEILAEWGDEGKDAARLSLWIDFPFLVVYSAFWALAARALGGRRVWVAAPVAGAFDFLENVCLHLVLGGAGGDTLPALAAVFATVKFVALTLVEGYVAIVLIRRYAKWAVAAAALAIVLALVLAFTISDLTETDSGGIGRTVPASRGDIHVREDGPRDAPPVVLIHGFGASMRWWDDVVPALARDFRVVRIDLLGHGGSQKPLEGYSMEEQAQTVTQAMLQLGVERAPIVGHSMGGVVGTAMVERFPRFVSRLMMIGTPPDAEDLEGGLLANAAVAPVIGQLNHHFSTDRFVRFFVEQGFAPEFDPPEHLVEDIFERTTWSSFKGSSDAIGDYWDEAPLNERLADEDVPVTVLLGEEENHTKRSVQLYNSSGARTVVMEGLDHSPMVESPSRTAPLIAAFARGR